MTRPRSAADIMPEYSAIPTPNNATSTVPSGTKPVKLVTRFSTIRANPSPFNRLTTSIIPSALRPLVPSGLGSITDTPKYDMTAESTNNSTDIQTNKITGCGNKLPSHSTPFKNRCIRELCSAASKSLCGGLPFGELLPCISHCSNQNLSTVTVLKVYKKLIKE